MAICSRILVRTGCFEAGQAVTHRPSLAPAEVLFYATAAYPCSYLAGRVARSQVASPIEAIDNTQYSLLVQHGFRRSGPFIYRPHCEQCQACRSIRLPVAQFSPNRSQKRAQTRHAQLTATVIEPCFSAEHYALYQLYQKTRHAGGGMDHDDVAQYIEFLVRTNVASFMVEFRQSTPDNAAGVLKMVSIIDRLDDGLSAVYTFYSPEPQHAYGTFNVLWQIEQTKRMSLPHLYLGYWIGSCKKMSYKTRFKPHELYVHGEWVRG
jgi:arginyl-tRNA--protein-N-Asp/Glu arginylyltransferase